MSKVQKHYEELLSGIYSWMAGGFEKGIEDNTKFFLKYEIKPCLSGAAVDLGCGCGFQSIPLARIGFSVISIDTDKKLLEELKENACGLNIRVVNADLLSFEKLFFKQVELIVCMTDTILHLHSENDVASLFDKAASHLSRGGKFVITFRDLSAELLGVDRFIPVKSDNSRILTCFLEYKEKKVRVNDILYINNNGKWELKKSCYDKLRLSGEWVKERLFTAGFNNVELIKESGIITIVAVR